MLERNLTAASEAAIAASNEVNATLRELQAPPYLEPLLDAIRRHDHEALRRLLDAADVDVNCAFPVNGDEDSDEFWTPLNLATALGRADTVRVLVARGADLDGVRGHAETVPFFW